MSNQELIEDVRSGARRLVWGLFALNIAFIGVTALRRGPVWWSQFTDDTNMWTRGLALQIAASCVVCAAICLLARYQRRRGLSYNGPKCLWMLIASGFAYLACDEQFSYHERVEAIYGIPGSYAILVYVFAGAVIAWPLFGQLRKSPGSFRLFVTGMCVMVASTVPDTLAQVRGPLMAVEEIMELTGSYLFLAAFTIVLSSVVIQILGSSHLLSKKLVANDLELLPIEW